MRNSVEQGQSCMIVLTEAMMTKGLSEEVILIIIAVVCAVIILLIIIIACFCCQEKEDNEERGKYKQNMMMICGNALLTLCIEKKNASIDYLHFLL